ncbi:TPA: hypothetical protein HIP68_004606 [Escherichia coli]|nr:hypothetical protein [Escherichia coli]
MDEQIKALLNQVRILEEEANKHSGAERAELFKAAGKLKDQVATLLNQCGKGQQQQESKIPDPTTYFGAKLPEGFENYFSGDYLTPEMESYFDNLTKEQRDYFATPKIQNFDNAPSAKPEPAKTQEFDDWELRRRILNAIGIPC